MAPAARRPLARAFASGDDVEKYGYIPKDMEFQVGRRRTELENDLKGEVTFNRDPIVPPADQGTKENPILVPSALDERVVGYECPEVHQLYWFNLAKGPVHYIPDLGLYFKLYPTV